MARQGCVRCGGMGKLSAAPVASVACSGCGGEVCDRHLWWLDGEPWCVRCVPPDRKREAVRTAR